MNVTEVRIFPKEGVDKKLRAFATITLDHCFVVRDIKIIEGTQGLFVAMPSRRVKEPCPKCGHRNVVRSRFCNQCGLRLPQMGSEHALAIDSSLRQAEHKDVAHPITAECRSEIQRAILEAYYREKDRLQPLQEQGQQQDQ